MLVLATVLLAVLVVDDLAGVALLDDAALALARAVYLSRGFLIVFVFLTFFLR